MALTPKQQRFVEEYLIDLNATQAAIRAGYSAKTAKQQGGRLLTNVDVSEAVAAAQTERSEKTGVTVDWVLTEAAAMYEEAKADGDRKNALKALEMCGKHVAISAFKEGTANVNVTVAPSLQHFYGNTDGNAG